MSFPTLQMRPNEKNPMVLRAHEFLRQATQLVERNLITNEGKKVLARDLNKMAAEVKGIYELDEKRTDAQKKVQLMEQLKSAHKTSIEVMEDRFVNADLARQVAEMKLKVQKKHSEVDYLRNSVQAKKAELQREVEKNEKRLSSIAKENEEMSMRSSRILKHLENSEDVSKLRKMEEQKREMEEEAQKLREQKQALADEILCKKATLKAEKAKPFKTMVIECAKHYKLCKSLTPKLAISQENVQALKEQEEMRRASGSLDETIPFDRSFILASMEKDTPSAARKLPPPPQPTISQPLSEITVSAEKTIESPPRTAQSPVQEPVAVAPSTSAPCAPSESMETQRVIREVTPEVEMEEEEDASEKDKSMDVMEEEEVVEEPMEQEQPDQEPISTSSPVSAASPTLSSTILQPRAETPSGEKENSKNDKTGDLLQDVAVRLEEADEVMSDNGSNRDDNFSFNFFGNSNKNGGNEAENGNDSEANFDFNFGASGSGDDVSAGGAGAFDFLGTSEDNATGVVDSDPFGFGKTGNGGAAAGDMSFNFNFDDANGESEGGAAGNSTFFNF